MRQLSGLLKYLLFIILISFIFFFAFWILDLLIGVVNPAPKPTYGTTFSITYTEYLGLKPEEVYQNILSELGVKKVRIPVYWEMVEKSPGQFDFSQTDRLLNISSKEGVKVILVVGYRAPRWPECFAPAWAKDMPKEKLQERVLNLIDKSVDHFKNRSEIELWQVENEPMLPFFGECEIFDEEFLKKEVDLVHSKDNRPVVITDSGELSSWSAALKYSDQMGSSLYRVVYNPMFGFFNYPFPPLFYRMKAFIMPKIFGSHSDIFISELQTEPWIPNKPLLETPLEEQKELFSLDDFKEIIKFSANTHLSKQYLWGVEWWYFMKTKGHPEYFEYAKELFK